MSMPPSGQWGPGVPPPNPQQPPPGYYPPPQGWGPPPPQKSNSALKWLLGAVAVLLVVAITVGVTVLVTRDGSGGDGPTETPDSPSDIASADDTGPVEIITVEPTCDSWRAIQDTLAAAQANGWADRDPSIPASEWTPSQRSQYDAVGATMRTAADQAIALAKQTPHRVMRELYEQFIAYGRIYADSLESYVSDDDVFARTNVGLSTSISTTCDAIEHGAVINRASAVPPGSPPDNVSAVGDLGDPRRFLTTSTSACVDWIARTAALDGQLEDWSRLDPEVPASRWDSAQRSVQEAAARTFDEYADDIEQIGRSSGDGTFEDFAVLAAQYFRAYAIATATYSVDDYYIVNPAMRLKNAVRAACQASAVHK